MENGEEDLLGFDSLLAAPVTTDDGDGGLGGGEEARARLVKERSLRSNQRRQRREERRREAGEALSSADDDNGATTGGGRARSSGRGVGSGRRKSSFSRIRSASNNDEAKSGRSGGKKMPPSRHIGQIGKRGTRLQQRQRGGEKIYQGRMNRPQQQPEPSSLWQQQQQKREQELPSPFSQPLEQSSQDQLLFPPMPFPPQHLGENSDIYQGRTVRQQTQQTQQPIQKYREEFYQQERAEKHGHHEQKQNQQSGPPPLLLEQNQQPPPNTASPLPSLKNPSPPSLLKLPQPLEKLQKIKQQLIQQGPPSSPLLQQRHEKNQQSQQQKQQQHQQQPNQQSIQPPPSLKNPPPPSLLKPPQPLEKLKKKKQIQQGPPPSPMLQQPQENSQQLQQQQQQQSNQQQSAQPPPLLKNSPPPSLLKPPQPLEILQKNMQQPHQTQQEPKSSQQLQTNQNNHQQPPQHHHHHQTQQQNQNQALQQNPLSPQQQQNQQSSLLTQQQPDQWRPMQQCNPQSLPSPSQLGNAKNQYQDGPSPPLQQKLQVEEQIQLRQQQQQQPQKTHLAVGRAAPWKKTEKEAHTLSGRPSPAKLPHHQRQEEAHTMSRRPSSAKLPQLHRQEQLQRQPSGGFGKSAPWAEGGDTQGREKTQKPSTGRRLLRKLSNSAGHSILRDSLTKSLKRSVLDAEERRMSKSIVSRDDLEVQLGLASGPHLDASIFDAEARQMSKSLLSENGVELELALASGPRLDTSIQRTEGKDECGHLCKIGSSVRDLQMGAKGEDKPAGNKHATKEGATGLPRRKSDPLGEMDDDIKKKVRRASTAEDLINLMSVEECDAARKHVRKGSTEEVLNNLVADKKHNLDRRQVRRASKAEDLINLALGEKLEAARNEVRRVTTTEDLEQVRRPSTEGDLVNLDESEKHVCARKQVRKASTAEDLINLAVGEERNLARKQVRRVSMEKDVRNPLKTTQANDADSSRKPSPTAKEGTKLSKYKPVRKQIASKESEDEISLTPTPTGKKGAILSKIKPFQDLSDAKLGGGSNYTTKDMSMIEQRRNSIESSMANLQMKTPQATVDTQQQQIPNKSNDKRILPSRNSDQNFNSFTAGSDGSDPLPRADMIRQLSSSLNEGQVSNRKITEALGVSDSANGDGVLNFHEGSLHQEEDQNKGDEGSLLRGEDKKKGDKDFDLLGLLAIQSKPKRLSQTTVASTGVDDRELVADVKQSASGQTAARRRKSQFFKEFDMGNGVKAKESDTDSAPTALSTGVEDGEDEGEIKRRVRKRTSAVGRPKNSENAKEFDVNSLWNDKSSKARPGKEIDLSLNDASKGNNKTSRGSRKNEEAADAAENSTAGSKGSSNKKGPIIEATELEEISTIGSKRSGTQSREEEDHEDVLRGDRKKEIVEKLASGFHVSPLMACILCTCYCLSLLLVGVIGYGIHLFEEGKETTSSSGRDVGSVGHDNEMSPSRRPSQNTQYPTEAGIESFVTKTSPSTSPPSQSTLSRPAESPLISPLMWTNQSNFQQPPRQSALPSVTSHPSIFHSHLPSFMPTASPISHLSAAPSSFPSSSPTANPGCPKQLLNSKTLDHYDGVLTMNYEVVLYPKGNDLGGLLCVTLEYSGVKPAGWIGLAFSEASRDPVFGRKEAVIGVPGVKTSTAVIAVGDVGDGSNLGQQSAAAEGGPAFYNPGKYEIPAGGVEGKGYYGPSLTALRGVDAQTLIDGSIAVDNPYTVEGVAAEGTRTRMSFAKLLREPGEIEIDPRRDVLVLHAVATVDDDGDYYAGNPEWKVTRMKFLDSSDDLRSGSNRKRKRRHVIHSNF